MNTIYRIVWNVTTGKWTVASEFAKGRKKNASSVAGLVTAIALGVVANGNVLAQDAAPLGADCKTTSGQVGSVTASGICAADISSAMGRSSIGTYAALDDTYIQVLAGSSGNGATTAAGVGSIAIGSGAKSDTNNSASLSSGGIAIGQNASGTHSSIAVGGQANATSGSTPGAWSAIAVGQTANADGDGAMAVGAAANAVGVSAFAAGRAASATADYAVALGSAKADKVNATALGSAAEAHGDSATAVGHAAIAQQDGNIAFGTGAYANGVDALAFGANTSATGAKSVALGSYSVANADNTISVGSDGTGTGNAAGAAFQRRIVNMAAGIGDFDAVNVSQLKPLVDGLGGGAAINPSTGAVTGPTYSFADGSSFTNVGSALTNLDGRTTTNTTNITNLQAQIGAAASTSAYFKASGLDDGTDDAVASGSNAVAAGAGSKATGANSTAIGYGGVAAADNAVALGAGSVADRANSVSVGSAGNERQVTNVAAGTEDTDAVNVAQLKAAGLVDENGNAMDAVVYDANANHASVTFGGGMNGTLLTNVAAGWIDPASKDAVNGSQLWDVQNQVNQLGDRVTNIETGTTPVNPGNPGNGDAGAHFASSGDQGNAAVASGSSSIAVGEGSQATGSNSSAIGAGSVASGNNSSAIGSGSQATGDNSVALGNGSVADRPNSVSVGSEGNGRQVTNVAAGTERTDAANWGQVQDSVNGVKDWANGQFDTLNRRVDNVQRQANRGIASSAALINNMPYLPGKITMNAGVAAYRGESALGVGISGWSSNGRFNVNAGVSAAKGDSPIFRMGVGMVLGD